MLAGFGGAQGKNRRRQNKEKSGQEPKKNGFPSLNPLPEKEGEDA
jgi:hypothetical protein